MASEGLLGSGVYYLGFVVCVCCFASHLEEGWEAGDGFSPTSAPPSG